MICLDLKSSSVSLSEAFLSSSLLRSICSCFLSFSAPLTVAAFHSQAAFLGRWPFTCSAYPAAAMVALHCHASKPARACFPLSIFLSQAAFFSFRCARLSPCALRAFSIFSNVGGDFFHSLPCQLAPFVIYHTHVSVCSKAPQWLEALYLVDAHL
jgi:hypothetical protein